MPVEPSGRVIGHYTILEKIGSGGMGDVYLAEDNTLGRKVALKILPPELAADIQRRARFTREAKAIAALNHPNIITVYSVEESGDVHFITMELVKGITLARALPSKGLALAKFFEVAIPLTDAIAAAHQQGITHRDLKPANVMVRDDGRVKVLDFGLAKAGLDVSSRVSQLPTESATKEGHLVGTPAYMSPEQAEGGSVDSRSDIFSLGIVFYEMLTGQRPFGGGTSASTISSILKDTPRPVNEVQPAIPRELARVVHRCLAKNPLDRYQSAIDLRHDLEEAKQDVESGDVRPMSSRPQPRRRSMLALSAMLAAAAVAGLVGVWLLSGRRNARALSVPRVHNAVQVTSALDVESYPTWSPDGLRVAYQAHEFGYLLAGSHDIWVAQLGSGEPVNLTKGHPANDRKPSWSPNGREIAFFSDRDGVWGVYIVAAIGGNPRRVLSLPGIGNGSWNAPQWSSDGSRLFVPVREAETNVVIVLTLGSLESVRVMLPDHEGDLCWDFSVSPDDRRFAYVEAGGGNPDVTRLWTIAASGGDATPLTEGRTNVWSPTWSKDGRSVFYVSNRGGSMDLWQQAVAEDGTAIGEPHAVTQGLGIRSAVFSPDGTRLAYARGGRVSNVWRVPILSDRPATWADALKVTSEHAYIEFVDVSPDGQRLAISSDRRGNQDLWLLPSTGGEMTQLTTDPTNDWNPRWSPDGREIAFYAYRSGNRDLWVIPAGGGPARQLTSQPGRDWFQSWSPDGHEIAYQANEIGAGAVSIVAASGGDPRVVTAGNTPEWSPDGRWLAFLRQGAIYRVARDGSQPVLLLQNQQPNSIRFARDGRSIYYSVISGPRENHDLWRLFLEAGKVSRLTKLEGRRGRLGYIFSVDARYLYLTWYEDEGDIWVMDVVSDAVQ
jgi:Tol biopolymer transport system component